MIHLMDSTFPFVREELCCMSLSKIFSDDTFDGFYIPVCAGRIMLYESVKNIQR